MEKFEAKVFWQEDGNCILVNAKISNSNFVLWKESFESSGNLISPELKKMLTCTTLESSSEGVEYDFVLIKSESFDDMKRNRDSAIDYATKNGYIKLSLYESCLLSGVIYPKMLSKLNLEWVMCMTEEITSICSKPKSPIISLNKLIEIGKEKLVFSLCNRKRSSKQNPFGVYAFIENKEHLEK